MNFSKSKGILAYFAVAAVILVFLIFGFRSLMKGADTTTFSDVIQHFDDYSVSEFSLNLGSGELKYKLAGGDDVYVYKVPNVSVFYNELFNENENYRDDYNALHADAPLKLSLIHI